ncbi:MAG TPA: glycoside hydrolase family 76 protein [Acidobacteriaceae bacterium]|nr:glycoside hydrolase family 76 protein [Acidobacteriaceae bacterium]
MICSNAYKSLVGALVVSALWVGAPVYGQQAAAPTAPVAPAANAPAPPPAPNPQPASNLDRAKFAVQAMQKTYTLDTGLYKTTGWWNAANAITTLADYARVAQTHAYDWVFSNTLFAAQKRFPGFINEYYDDEGWWLLAWVDAYDNTHDARYLDAAKLIFQDMTYGWNDETCGGGVWWSKDRRNDNAIENELFLASAASLANRTTGAQRAEYLGWAKKEWNWFSHSGMINEKHLINDGLNKECKNNGAKTWSYNQGVILGGLVELHKANHDASLLTQANEIAQATIANLTDTNGVLRDGCENQQRRNNQAGPHCGGDATQFKGVFVRNLRMLAAADPHGSQYNGFIQKNADSIWSQTGPDSYQLGEGWAAPFGGVNASTQSSALDVLVAAAAISHK